MLKAFINRLRKEALFFIVLFLCIITSFFVKPDFSAIDWKIIFSLLNLMLVSAALIKCRLMDRISISILSRYDAPRKIGVAMIFTTALVAMFLTNDVALIAVVPLTIIVAKRADFDPFRIIVLETAAANIGSSITPFGNPQNLYLYSYFNIGTIEFFKILLPVAIIGLILLVAANMTNSKGKVRFVLEKIDLQDSKKLVAYIACFLLVLLSIIRILNFRIASIVVLAVFFVLDRKLFLKVDYFLLGTFMCFFILVDNLIKMGFIQTAAEIYLRSPIQVLTASSVLSQFISNVPSAILLSGFTGHFKALLVGVNIGGLGTMIASLANLISYKLYAKEYDSKKYKQYFYIVNIAMFAALFLVALLELKVLYN